jgi:hypothetical protein
MKVVQARFAPSETFNPYPKLASSMTMLEREHENSHVDQTQLRNGSMSGIHFSPKGAAIFLFVAAILALLVMLDRGSGAISRAWPLAMLGVLAAATLAIYLRMWSARADFEQVRKIESQSLYGVLPKRLREWLFP